MAGGADGCQPLGEWALCYEPHISASLTLLSSHALLLLSIDRTAHSDWLMGTSVLIPAFHRFNGRPNDIWQVTDFSPPNRKVM